MDLWRYNGIRTDFTVFNNFVLQGYLKKQVAQNTPLAFFKIKKSYLRRYFILDFTTAQITMQTSSIEIEPSNIKKMPFANIKQIGIYEEDVEK
jgi:ABC-type uncharacterized transport system permease subunit